MGKNSLIGDIEQAQKGIEQDDPLEQLEALHGARNIIDWYVERAVADCRGVPIPWQRIGDALGISRQAAFKRFRPD
jgi:hypothetical protein